MGLSSAAMDWWDEWKLRILVLCSLFVQFFLFFSAWMRRLYILRRLRVLVWIAYIGGDALAVYALATLFNRQKQMTVGGGGNSLEVIWAPVLLIHLGGQIYITAYSLEDNELWTRHTITLVSQVTVALYVFCKWWSGEKKLLQAAILLFIMGILKFSQKPWALRRASFRTMAASTNLSPQRDEIRSGSKWSALRNWLLVPIKEAQEENMSNVICSLEEYVKRARELVQGAKASDHKAQQQQQAELFKKNKNIAIKYVYRMFLDLSSPYPTRLHYLQYFLKFDDRYYMHKMLGQWIERQFSFMYSKIRSSLSGLGICLFYLLVGLAIAPLVLFAGSSKDGYSKGDINVTYILFSGIAVIELAPFWIFLLCMPLFRCNNLTNREDMYHSWPDMVSQHNIMSFCARKKKKEPSTLMKLPGFSYLRDCIIKHWYIWHKPAAQQITALVRRHIEDGWKEIIRDPPTYRRFSNLRGEQTLRNHHLLGQEQLDWTFNLPFDECLLVWHLATDLCSFHHTLPQEDAIIQCRDNSEIISNHMIYLLFICPEMLLVGTRQDLFMIACGDIEHMIKDEPLSSLDKGSITRRILAMEQGDDKNDIISNAHKLANKLLIGLNDKERWEVIQGVWVEMLCYSASRCRGYDHAKSLAYGAEFLTNVWLLWSVMGMETLPDKIHNPGPPPESNDHGEEQASATASV